MEAEVIAVVSPKGGTGKTIYSASLSVVLARSGFKVLLVDSDSATNGLTLLLLGGILSAPEENEDTQLLGLFDNMGRTPDAVDLDQFENLSVIPASYKLQQTSPALKDQYDHVLQEIIATNRRKYDYIVLDLEAGPEPYVGAAVRRARRVVIVTEPDPVSAAGVVRFRALLLKEIPYRCIFLQYNKCLDKGTLMASRIPRFDMQELPAIPFDSRVMRAYGKSEVPIDTTSQNIFTIAMVEVATNLLDDPAAARIREWRGKQGGFLAASVADQLDSLGQSLESIEKLIESRYEMVSRTRAEADPRGYLRSPSRLIRLIALPLLVSYSVSFLLVVLRTGVEWSVLAGILLLLGPIGGRIAWMYGRRASSRKLLQALEEDVDHYRAILKETQEARERLRLLV